MPELKTYRVTVPIVGHAFIVVQAESEQDAISQAIVKIEQDDIEEWLPVEDFAEATFRRARAEEEG